MSATTTSVIFFGAFAHLSAQTMFLSGPVQNSNESLVEQVQLRNDVFAVNDAVGSVGVAVPLQVQLPQTIPVGLSYLSVSGIPSGFSLTSGFDAGDAWIVSLKDVNRLALTCPPDFAGIVTLNISLVRGKDYAPEERMVTITVKPNKDITKTPQSSVAMFSTPEPLNTSGTPLRTEKRISDEDEKILLDRAADLVKSLDIVSARLIYQELARQGSARGTFLMGQSFDPQYTPAARQRPQDEMSNIQQAQKWYDKARQMGYSEAEPRLKALAER